MLIKALRTTGLSLLLVTGVWAVLNLFDASPAPGLPDWTLKPQDIAARDNGFFALVGIGEPEGKPPAERYAAGVARFKGELARATTYLQQNPGFVGSSGETSFEDIPGPAKPALNATAWSDSFCDWRSGPCLRVYEKRRARIEKDLTSHQWLQERYVELYGSSTFTMPVQDFAIIMMQPSPFRMLELGSALVRTTAGLAAIDGRGPQAVEWLAKDVRFQRQLLRSANTHHQAASALGSLARNLSLLDEILTRDPGLLQGRHAVADILQPFTVAERNLQPPLDGIFAGTMHMVDTMASGNNLEATFFLGRPLFRRNAFTNHQWQRHVELKRLLMQTPASELETAFERWSAQGAFPETGLWQGIRNPAGTLLSQIMLPANGGHYMLRHEVDAYLHMLDIKYGVITAEGKPATEGFHSKPVSRDAAGNQLSFTPFKDTRWPKHLVSVSLPEAVSVQ